MAPTVADASFSSEVLTTQFGDRVNIRYSTDGGACTSFGPELFHSSTLFETHTNISVVNLEPDVYTKQPCFRLNDLGGGGAELQFSLNAV